MFRFRLTTFMSVLAAGLLFASPPRDPDIATAKSEPTFLVGKVWITGSSCRPSLVWRAIRDRANLNHYQVSALDLQRAEKRVERLGIFQVCKVAFVRDLGAPEHARDVLVEVEERPGIILVYRATILIFRVKQWVEDWLAGFCRNPGEQEM